MWPSEGSQLLLNVSSLWFKYSIARVLDPLCVTVKLEASVKLLPVWVYFRHKENGSKFRWRIFWRFLLLVFSLLTLQRWLECPFWNVAHPRCQTPTASVFFSHSVVHLHQMWWNQEAAAASWPSNPHKTEAKHWATVSWAVTKVLPLLQRPQRFKNSKVLGKTQTFCGSFFLYTASATRIFLKFAKLIKFCCFT